MQLSQELINRFCSSLSPSDINAYIDSNYNDYLNFLKDNYSSEELEKEKLFYEENQ